MSRTHALSDEEVAGELRKMTAFIRQEAYEKAKEIQIKADEEFAIEKSKLVRQETSSIDQAYEKKFKQASMSQQITRSTLANKTRLKVLGARQELLDDLFERARKRLVDATTKDQEQERYESVLKDLILEGAYALNEKKVQVRAREQDGDLVGRAVESARSEYKDKVHREVEIVLDGEEPLEEGCTGGVMILSESGKIDINNTLDERLRILQNESLPAVRTMLFGKNENRKFFD
ncbi:MAG: V-ATPase V1 sector subunit E [Peltula sp. TS41687]|nr:MAG: V-ATPase V1 sector subunit E [Peltula sp. TS41687]